MKCQNCGQNNPSEAHFCAHCGATLIAVVEPLVSGIPVEQPSAIIYVGFWRRFWADLIDIIILILVFIPVVFWEQRIAKPMPLVYAIIPQIILNLVSCLYYVLFTGLKGQTPGKMIAGIRVTDAEGKIPGLARAALREIIGKTLSALAFCLGFLWIVWDKKKQGWHDKIASTFVVRAR